MTITGKAKLAGVMGWPISHSRSPRLHTYWLDHYKIDGAYVPLAVRPEDCAEMLRALPKLGFRGCNLTIPHKEIAFGVVDALTDRAQRIGAVNTVIVQENGTLLGDNTDGFGFLENLRHGRPGFSAAAGPAVVLGAGGAARAVLAALQEAGCPEIRLLNRSRDRAEALATALPKAVQVDDWEQRDACLEGASLLVNTTSLGMSGQPPLCLDLDALPIDGMVTDVVYAPLETDLLAQARRRGHPVVDGLGMLLHQARPGFAAWFGQWPDVTESVRTFVMRDL